MPRSTNHEPTCLFPTEPEIAKAVLGPTRAKMWPALAKVLERKGLPPVDVRFGGRYWPGVREFLDREQTFSHDPGIPIENRGSNNVDRTGGVRPRPEAYEAPQRPRRSVLGR